MTGTGFKRADISVAATGGGSGDAAADTLTLAGSGRAETVAVKASTTIDVTGLPVATHIGGEETIDHLQINTGGGNDRVNVDPAVNTRIGVAVDLGSGQH
jgi:hypothetical protein